MSNNLRPPDAVKWVSTTDTSVRLDWPVVAGAAGYEVKGGGSDLPRFVVEPTALIKGLMPSAPDRLMVRAVGADGERTAWTDVDIITSVGVPVAPDYEGTIPILDADRQEFNIRLPDPEGKAVECRLFLWWHPSDKGWWMSLEAPVNTRVVSSRRIALNTGLLDGMSGILGGNIVMRATGEGSAVEPDRLAFANNTHALRWETGT